MLNFYTTNKIQATKKISHSVGCMLTWWLLFLQTERHSLGIVDSSL